MNGSDNLRGPRWLMVQVIDFSLARTCRTAIKAERLGAAVYRNPLGNSSAVGLDLESAFDRAPRALMLTLGRLLIVMRGGPVLGVRSGPPARQTAAAWLRNARRSAHSNLLHG